MKLVMNDNEKKGVIICGAFVAVVVAFVLGLNIGHYSEAQKARMQRRAYRAKIENLQADLDAAKEYQEADRWHTLAPASLTCSAR